MSATAHPWTARLRHAASPEGVAAAAALAGAVTLLSAGGYLAGWQRTAGWGAVLLALAVALRHVWPLLFGPVFAYDLARSVRRGRVFSLRCLYAGALLVVLFLL